LRLEGEALSLGQRALDLEHGNIANALYRVYLTYRQRFIEERRLGDGPRAEGAWCEALIDARQLEAFVNDTWLRMIRSS
jgi:hypothetical protein